MVQGTEFEAAALQALLEKAKPRLDAALRQHGVSSPDQLPPEVSAQVFQDAIVQTAATEFPGAQVDALKHGLEAFRHPRFTAAFKRLQARLASPIDAFDVAGGIDAAIVLAGFGLPVAPFDRKAFRILAEPSNDIDQVASTFSTWKTAFVGYSLCDLPFYIMITDCVASAARLIATKPQLNEIRRLLERSGTTMPVGNVRPFQHAVMLFPREPGDTISTISLLDPSPHGGSVALYAGWTVDGVREGGPNDGYLPVPLQFLSAAMRDTQAAIWIWRPVGARMMMN